MANKQVKKSEMQKSSSKTDDQIISDLIENRKRQMEALVKIMTSMEVEELDREPAKSRLKKSTKKAPNK